MTHPETASFAEFARIAGFKRGYITELNRGGRLVLADGGKRVHVAESLALIRSTADPSKVGVAARHALSRSLSGAEGAGDRSPASAGQGSAAVDPDDVPAANDYDGHSTRRSRALADKAEWDAKAAERDYLESIGKLLQADEVEGAVAAAAATLRTALENLPNTLAPELAAASDEARVRVILGEAIEHALEEISRQFAALAKAGSE